MSTRSHTTMRVLAPIVAAAATLTAAAPALAKKHDAKSTDPAAFAALEKQHAAKLGVTAIDTGSGRVVSHRAGERFPFASTGKALAAGVLLHRASEAKLSQVVTWRQSDVVANSPVTDSFVTSGLALRHVLQASLDWSDNTAANVIVRELGGPASVQQGVRSLLGDTTTRIDRIEPDLNTAIPGDPRDTTTPTAMASDVRQLLVGKALRPTRRALLKRLMLSNTTGDATIRAGVPKGWKVADKTGTADYGTRNDVAVAWPRHGAPVVITVFTTKPQEDAKTDDALVAEATRAAVKALRR